MTSEDGGGALCGMIWTPWKARAAAVVSGGLLAAAFPPLNWWLLTLVAWLPLLLAAEARAETGKAPGRRFWPGFRLGWMTGLVFYMATLWWVQHVTFPGMVVLTLYLALYPGVFAGLAGWLGTGRQRGESMAAVAGKIVMLAGAWAGLEWVRSVALSGFPWNALAVPLFPSALARQVVPVTGVAGLSGLALVPLLAVLAMRRRRKAVSAGAEEEGSSGRKPDMLSGAARTAAVAVAMAAMTGGLEWAARKREPRAPGPAGQVLLVQPNLSMAEKMADDPEFRQGRYHELEDLTEEGLRRAPGADLVVWPESAVPDYLDEMLKGGAFAQLLTLGNFTLVTGSDDRDMDRLYNSVAAMRGTVGNLAVQPKVRLVPFGEFIPFRREFPVFEWMVGDLIPMDFTPGNSLEPMRVAGQGFSIVPLVCFEDTISSHARRFVRPEPQVLVNVTNDNWFHQSPATEIHFANARWRAPELSRPLLRSANTGVSAVVEPWGEVRRLPSFVKDVLAAEFSTGDGRVTFYAAHGDVVAQAGGGGALLAWLGVALVRRRRQRGRLSRPENPPPGEPAEV